MKKIVVYKSKTGFTKRYSEWIAEELGCEAIALNSVNEQKLAEYDLVIYGGGFMGGMIGGANKIKKISHKNLIIFGTGATPNEATEMIDKAKEQNLTPEEMGKIPFFYMQSGLDYDKMGFVSKKMMKMLLRMLNNKKDKTVEDEEMLKAISHSFDACDRSKIEPLVEFVRAME